MSRKWLRLMAWVSVAAFVVPTHAVAFRPAPDTPPPARAAAPAEAAPCCEHCAGESEAAAPEAPSEEERCPDGPSCPCCPTPGGCALCNAAKAPCVTLAATFLVALPCLGDSLVEAPPLYTPPFAGRLTPPPKA